VLWVLVYLFVALYYLNLCVVCVYCVCVLCVFVCMSDGFFTVCVCVCMCVCV